MRFRRPKAPKGRQRRQSEPPTVQPSNFSNRARLPDQENTGRQPGATLERASRAGKFWLHRSGLLILLLALLLSAANLLSLSAQAQVRSIDGDQSAFVLHSQAEYQAAANTLLAQSVWSRNKITIDTGSLRRQLLKQFPELNDVGVTIPLLSHRPIVYVEPSKPVLILNGRGGAFVIGDSGKALTSAATVADLNQPTLPVIADLSGLLLKTGHQALPAVDVQFIQAIMTELGAKSFSVTTMSLPAAASELDVQLANQPYSVKFNLQSRDARQQAGTFLATIKQLQAQQITPGKYIDVRVDGRAYYQ